MPHQIQNLWVERGTRAPLWVPVTTEPRLRDCWAVNLSESGIGLISALDPEVAMPSEGDEFVVKFALPGSEGEVRARAYPVDRRKRCRRG